MKPNGKKYALRVVLFAVCAVGLSSGLAGAETVRGTFKLSVPVHWGPVVLVPGEYEFAVDTGSITRVVTVRSQETGWTGMILAASMDNAIGRAGSAMKLARSDETLYVKTLYLDGAGIALEFTVPSPSMTKLAKSPPMTRSASGNN